MDGRNFRNKRIATKLTSELNGLMDATKSSANAPPSPATSAISNNNIQTGITNINNLLSEAVSARINKDSLNDPKTQALVISNLGNEIYNSYGKAFEIEPVVIGNISANTMDRESHGSNTSNNDISGVEHVVSSNNNTKPFNSIAYQTAQPLASQALETFNKNLKPIAASNATAVNSKIEKDLIDIKRTIDNKGPFMDIAKLVHTQLHPALISTYNLH